MNWHEYTYKITTANKEEVWYNGHRFGSLVHNLGCTLTHLKSGMKIAEFSNETDVRRVAEYLMNTYRAEFEAFDKAIKRNMKPDTIINLPQANDLINKVKYDSYYRQQIEEFGFKKESTKK